METNIGEWLLKIGGPLGLVVLLLLLYYWKVVLPEQKKTRDDYKAALDLIVADARNERDYARQQREKEVDKYIQSVDAITQRFEKITEALTDQRRPRQK